MEASRQPQVPDMFGMWKELLAKSQDSMEGAMRQTMATEEFANGLAKWMELVLVQKQMVNKAMEEYLQAAPIPSRTDLTRLAGQVVSLDAKVDRLESYLEERLEPMIQGVGQQLSRLEAQLALLAGAIPATQTAAAGPVPEPAPVPEEVAPDPVRRSRKPKA
jgi:polyhydroxyalkanoic acid synthase PhaR subunit